MSLTIRDPGTVRLVHALAERWGVSPEEAIRRTVARALGAGSLEFRSPDASDGKRGADTDPTASVPGTDDRPTSTADDPRP